MNTKEVVKSLDLPRYKALLDAGSGQDTKLAILVDNEAVTLAGFKDKTDNFLAAALNPHILQRAPLLDYQLTPIAELILCGAPDLNPNQPDNAHELNPVLFETMAACAQEELALTTELLDMTEELTSRYEELNLVFSNQAPGDAQSSIEQQLSDIVESSSQYMQLSLCFMVLGNQGLSFLSASNERLEQLGNSISLLAKPVTRWLEENQGSHVFNNGLEFPIEVPPEFKSWRHIITPITVGTDDNVAGFLIVARSHSEDYFTNSDKNLLEVMAQKASKLVRSTYDDLTRLLRRSAFQVQLTAKLQPSARTKGALALLLINIDRMQVINETHSHDAGNQILKWVARHLEDAKGSDDIIGRFGGDQFLMLLRRKSSKQLEEAARQIQQLINDSDFSWHGASIEVTISAGLAIIQESTRRAGQALAEAEFACSAAKEHGGGNLEVFASGDALLLERHAQLNQVSVIQNALKADEFVLYVQPIKPLVDQALAPHAEILIRLRDKDQQIIPPGLFLPAAERFNLMPSIDRWVIEHAMAAIEQYSAEVELSQLVLTINLSGQALSDSGFIQFLRAVLEKYNPRPGSICFEVTETTAIRDMQLAREIMSDLRSRGVKFALDDFGTGLSSFSYLQQLPLDTLKIDGSFVREIVTDDVARTMVKAINDVGQSMGLTTVAEFVSNPEIEGVLKDIGVNYGQGYSLAKPLPLHDYLASLRISRQPKSA